LEVISVYVVFKIMRPEKTTKGVGVDGEERTKDLALSQSNVERSGDLKGDQE